MRCSYCAFSGEKLPRNNISIVVVLKLFSIPSTGAGAINQSFVEEFKKNIMIEIISDDLPCSDIKTTCWACILPEMLLAVGSSGHELELLLSMLTIASQTSIYIIRRWINSNQGPMLAYRCVLSGINIAQNRQQLLDIFPCIGWYWLTCNFHIRKIKDSWTKFN